MTLCISCKKCFIIFSLVRKKVSFRKNFAFPIKIMMENRSTLAFKKTHTSFWIGLLNILKMLVKKMTPWKSFKNYVKFELWVNINVALVSIELIKLRVITVVCWKLRSKSPLPKVWKNLLINKKFKTILVIIARKRWKVSQKELIFTNFLSWSF